MLYKSLMLGDATNLILCPYRWVEGCLVTITDNKTLDVFIFVLVVHYAPFSCTLCLIVLVLHHHKQLADDVADIFLSKPLV